MAMVSPSPVTAFAEWLPGEMTYGVRKAGYDKQIERSRLPIDNPRSVYAFLGEEWHRHQLLKDQGNQHVDVHAMSAQLQLAKFAVGIFNKAGVGVWMATGAEPTEERFVEAAEGVAREILLRQPWDDPSYNADEVVNLPFEETPFADGIRVIMDGIARASEKTGIHQLADLGVVEVAMTLGGQAVQCYRAYALEHLTVDQYPLAPSQLAA